MAVDLDLRIGGRGKTQQAVTAMRPLTPEDLLLLEDVRDVKPQPLKELRTRHHTLARYIAEGRPDYVCAALLNYTPSRISILKTDHSFNQLVEFYRAQIEEAFQDANALAADLSYDFLRMLQTRAEENGEDMTNTFLLEGATRLMDRTGNGPTSKQDVNITVGFGSRLEEARKRAAAMRTIEHKDVTDA